MNKFIAFGDQVHLFVSYLAQLQAEHLQIYIVNAVALSSTVVNLTLLPGMLMVLYTPIGSPKHVSALIYCFKNLVDLLA